MGIYDRNYYREEPRRSGGIDSWSAVTTLIVVNVIVWVVNVFLSPEQFDAWGRPIGHWLNNHLALEPGLLAQPWKIYTLLTYGFAHDENNSMHILFNMFALWLFGRDVENIYGKKEFYRLYLSLIVLSGLGWIAVERFLHMRNVAADLRGLVGASGAITGVMTIYIFHYPHRTFLIYFVLPVPAWVLGIFYVFMNVTGAIQHTDNVAYTAHLAGAAFGYIYYRYHWSLASLLPSGNWFKNLTRPKMRVYRDNDSPGEQPGLQQRVDQILAKITREGESSLTDDERKTLEEASRRYRGR